MDAFGGDKKERDVPLEKSSHLPILPWFGSFGLSVASIGVCIYNTFSTHKQRYNYGMHLYL